MDTTIFEAPQSAETPKATYAATADCARISSLKNYQTEKGEFAGILRATMACPETEKVMDGRYGYSFFSDFGDGLGINYGEDGTMIDVFGRTAQRMGPDDWSELILAVREVGARFTKLTLTLVDVSRVFQTEEMAGKIQNREFVTRLRNLSMVRPLCGGSFSATFGTNRTQQLVVKGKEGGRISFSINFFGEQANEKADELLAAIQTERIGDFVTTALASAVDFKEPNDKDEDHRSEAPRWAKWVDFLNGAERIVKLSHAKAASPIEKSEQWLFDEAARAIARLSLALGEDAIETYKRLRDEGMKRLDEKDAKAINDYRKAHGMSVLSYDAILTMSAEGKEAARS